MKNEEKRDAIIMASIKLINELGLSGASMSKIAKEAGVSAATIYVYFKNKETLLEDLYLNVKKQMGEELVDKININLPVKKSMKQFFFNTFYYFIDNPDYLALMEQFDHSPQLTKACKETAAKYFIPLIKLIERGKKESIIRDVPDALLANFFFHPIIRLLKQHLTEELCVDKDILNLTFDMSWNAVKK